MQALEQQLQGLQDALQKKDLDIQVCKVEFDARCADDRVRFASEIKARNEELLALRVDRDDCVRQWAAEKSAMQEEIKVCVCVCVCVFACVCVCVCVCVCAHACVSLHTLDASPKAAAAKLRTSSRRTAELEVALREKVEEEGRLQADAAQLEEKLTQATETFRDKLHKCARADCR